MFSISVDDVERTVTIQLDGDEFTMEFIDAPEEEVIYTHCIQGNVSCFFVDC